MWFDFSDSVCISDRNFDKMISFVKNGNTIDQAFSLWRLTLNGYLCYVIDFIEDQVKEELRRRLDA